MLAFADDAAIARLFIAATRIPHERRKQWLAGVADRVDPAIATVVPSATNRSPAARRQARVRQRRKNGQHVYKLVLSDIAVEGLVTQMVTAGQLTEREALDHQRVEAELARLLEQQGAHWSR
jgi:hypothetical protein